MFEGVTRSPHIGDWEESVGRHEAGEMREAGEQAGAEDAKHYTVCAGLWLFSLATNNVAQRGQAWRQRSGF